MKKKLTAVGNSWALLFTKTMVELLKIDPSKDKMDIEFEGDVLKIRKSLED